MGSGGDNEGLQRRGAGGGLSPWSSQVVRIVMAEAEEERTGPAAAGLGETQNQSAHRANPAILISPPASPRSPATSHHRPSGTTPRRPSPPPLPFWAHSHGPRFPSTDSDVVYYATASIVTLALTTRCQASSSGRRSRAASLSITISPAHPKTRPNAHARLSSV